MKTPKSKSKLTRPEAVIDAVTGAKSYAGSISAMSGGTFDKKKQHEAIKAIAAGARFPSQIQIEGISPYSVHGQQGLHLFLQSLDKAGLAQFDGKKGWSLTSAGLAQLSEAE